MSPHWSQKTITEHCLSLFPFYGIGLQTDWLLVLGELLPPIWGLFFRVLIASKAGVT